MDVVYNEGDREMIVIQSESLRSLVEQVNTLNIKKEDIISMFPDPRTEEYVLVYYR